MADIAQQQINALLRTFATRLNRAAETGTPDDIHDLRVAIRRLSRALRVFASRYPDRSWKRVRAQLRRGMRLAGAVRDRDIALETLAKAGVAGRAVIVTRLQAARRQANSELLTEMRHWKEQGTVPQWAVQLTIQEQGDECDTGILPSRAAAYFAKVRKVLAADPRPRDLHRARLATKRFRYTVELFRSCYGKGLETRIEALRKIQQLLGDVNDSVASWRLLSQVTDRFPQRSMVRRFLKEQAKRQAEAFCKEWEEFDAPGREDWWTSYLKNFRKST